MTANSKNTSLKPSFTKLGLFAFLGMWMASASGAVAEESLSDDEFFNETAAVSDQTLSDTRGASGLIGSDIDAVGIAVLNGVSSYNTNIGGTTGNNVVSNNAFDNANGVAFVVQNSGNNAVINAAMVINLNIQ